MQDLSEKSRTVFNSLLESSTQRPKEVHKYYVKGDNTYPTTGIRSAAPASIAYAGDAHRSCQHYWKYDSTIHDPRVSSETELSNSLFASQTLCSLLKLFVRFSNSLFASHTFGAPTLRFATEQIHF
jgi:hypothetical protein